MGAFLAGRFGLEAREFDWRAPAADSLEIDYRLPADGLVHPPDGRAVSLGLPWICESARPSGEGDGPWRGFPFEQSDSWILPAGFGRLESGDLAGPGARGRWSLAGKTARREFVLADAALPAEETGALRHQQESLARFGTATAWK